MLRCAKYGERAVHPFQWLERRGYRKTRCEMNRTANEASHTSHMVQGEGRLGRRWIAGNKHLMSALTCDALHELGSECKYLSSISTISNEFSYSAHQPGALELSLDPTG